MITKLQNHFWISKENWTPKNGQIEFVNHYSIPNFDKGTAYQEATKTIKSNKYLITRPCVLVSKLNPTTPRIWLIEKLLPGTNVCSTEFVVLIPKRDEDLRYLYFLLKSEAVISRLGEIATGTSNSHQRVRLDAILELEVPWIKEEQQRTQLADFLWTLERKIELNRQLSKSLEEIAQTLFKSWFVSFDPVKAKMSGEKPAGMDSATAALFPDSMVESEFGLIPNGWKHKKVLDVLSRITVKGLPKSTALDNFGKTLVLEQGNSVIAGFIDDNADVEATGDSPAFVFGDHTCRMRLSTLPFSIFPNTIVLKSIIMNTYWAFGATNGLQKFETYRRHWMELAHKYLVVPSEELAHAYGKRVKLLYELIDVLMLESRDLAVLRQELLPRLISGVVEIPEEMLVS